MMLDGGDEIYVWIGENTTPEEQYGVTRMVKVIIIPKNLLVSAPSSCVWGEGNEATIIIHNYKICMFFVHSIGVPKEECCTKDI